MMKLFHWVEEVHGGTDLFGCLHTVLPASLTIVWHPFFIRQLKWKKLPFLQSVLWNSSSLSAEVALDLQRQILSQSKAFWLGTLPGTLNISSYRGHESRNHLVEGFQPLVGLELPFRIIASLLKPDILAYQWLQAVANILGRTARLECWPDQLQVGMFSEYIVSLLGSRGFWRTRKEQGYSHWSYLSPDRFFPPIIPFYDRKISKRTKELRDPTYYYHKFHGRDTNMADNQIWKCPWRHVKTKNTHLVILVIQAILLVSYLELWRYIHRTRRWI